jgi:hypothetical protein
MCLRVGEHLYVRKTRDSRMEIMTQWTASWIALFTKLRYCDQMKEGTKDGTRSTRVRKGENLRDLGVDVWIKENVERMLIGLGYGPVARTCEHTNDPSNSTKMGEVLTSWSTTEDVTNSAYLSTSHPLSAYFSRMTLLLGVNSIFYARPYHDYFLNILYYGMVICNFLQLE